MLGKMFWLNHAKFSHSPLQDLEKVFAQGKVDDDEAKTEGGEPRTSQ